MFLQYKLEKCLTYKTHVVAYYGLKVKYKKLYAVDIRVCYDI